jgi:DNA-binding transcriptional LysR family regulator
MDIYQLRTFVTVAREGNLTRATELLCVSQPAVSAHIKALEDELKLKLFLRTPRGVELTSAGESLLRDAEGILAAHTGMLSHARSLSADVAGRVKIGTVANPATLKLDDFMKAMAESYPKVQVQLLHGQSGDVINAVRAGKLDAGYAIGSEMIDGGLASLPLKHFEVYVAAPVAWKERIEFAEWDEILSMPWVWRTSSSFCHQLEEQIFRSRNVKPSVAVEVNNSTAAVQLVTAGMGLALMHDDEALNAEQDGRVVLWKKTHLEANLLFVYPAQRETEPMIASTLSIVKTTWRI